MSNTKTPEGYERISGLEAEGWFNMEVGAYIEGNLLGRHKMERTNDDGQESHFYQIQTQHKLEVWTGKGKERHLIPVKVGSIINLQETSALARDLFPVTQGSPKCVMVIVGAKVALDGGKSFWPVEIFCKPAIDLKF